MNKMSLKRNPGEAKRSLVECTLVYTSMGELGEKKDKDVHLQPHSTHTCL